MAATHEKITPEEKAVLRRALEAVGLSE